MTLPSRVFSTHSVASVLLLCALGASPGAHSASPSSDAAQLLREASICRKVGLKAKFDHSVMAEACRRFEAAAATGEGSVKAAAEAGLAQCQTLSGTGVGTVGDVMPLLAWLEDPLSAIREVNGDARGLAMKAALTKLAPLITIDGERQLPFVARCKSSDPALCAGVHESVLLSLKGKGLSGAYDASLARKGLTRAQLRPAGKTPDLAAGKALARKTTARHLIVLDVSVSPPTDCTARATLVGIKAWDWSLEDGTFTVLASTSAVGLDGGATKRAGSPILLFTMLLAFLLGWVRALRGSPLFRLETAEGKPDLDGSKRHALAIGLTCAGVACAAALAFPRSALPLAEGLALALDAGTRGPWGLFLPEVFFFPVVLGALLYVGPAAFAVVGEAAAQAQIDKLSMLGLKKVQWVELVPALQVGAAAGLALVLPVSMGPDGYLWAALLALPPGLLSLTLIAPLGRLGSSEARLPVIVGGLAAFAYFPLLVFTDPLFLGLAVGIVLTAALYIGLTSRRWDTASEAAVTEESADDSAVAGAKDGSIQAPQYLDHGVRAISGLEQLTAHSDDKQTVRQLWLVGQTGAGKTRAVDELLETLKKTAKTSDAPPLLIGRAAGEGSDGIDEDGRTFGFASDVLAGIFPLGERQEMMARQKEMREKALEAAHALSGLAVPGVGLLLGLADGDPPEGLTTDWLAEDVAESILKRSAHRTQVLFLDDLDQADEESVLLLTRIRDRLAAQQADGPHRVYVLVTTKVAPDALVKKATAAAKKELSEAFETLAIDPAQHGHRALTGLNPALIGQLVHHAGVTGTEGGAIWLSENTPVEGADTGPQPGSVLALLAHLEHVGLITTSDGKRVLAARDVLDKDKASIPKSLIEAQHRRLEALPHDDRFTLQMAAECGRRFTAHALAGGLERKPLDVLRTLHRIERETGFVHDDVEEDVFQFASESVRRALHQMTRRGLADPTHGDQDAEMLRVFHFQTARVLKENPLIKPEVLLRHCSHAGVRMAGSALDAAMKAAEQARRLMAWKRMKGFVDAAREHARLCKPTPEQRARLDFLEAFACKNLGGQVNRDRAYGLFMRLIESPTPGPGPETFPEFETLQAMLESRFEEKQVDDLTSLATWIDDARATRSWGDPLCSNVLAFYRESIRPELDRSADIVPALKTMAAELETMEFEEPTAEKNRALLLARVLQKHVDRRMGAKGVELEVLKAEFEPLWTRILSLKRQHGDLLGQALTLGTQGNFYNWRKQDYGRALALYERDLELILKMGDDSQLSSIQNRIATARFSLARGAESPERESMQRAALTQAQEALAVGVRLDREGDIAHAAQTVMDFSAQLGDVEAFDQAVAPAMTQEVWERFGKLPMMLDNYGAVREGAASIDRTAALEGVIDLITSVQRERPFTRFEDALKDGGSEAIQEAAGAIAGKLDVWDARDDLDTLKARFEAHRAAADRVGQTEALETVLAAIADAQSSRQTSAQQPSPGTAS